MSNGDAAKGPAGHAYKKMWVITGVATVAILLLVFSIVRFEQKRPATLPEKIVVTLRTARFAPYSYVMSAPHGFQLKTESLHYEAGILLFRLENKGSGQSVAITEQPLPPVLEQQSYANAKAVPGADGKAFIQYNGTRTMGGLLSNEHAGKKTLVIITTDDPIPEETVMDLLRELRPLQ